MILDPSGKNTYVIIGPFAPFTASMPPTHYPIETRPVHLSLHYWLYIRVKASETGHAGLFTLLGFHEADIKKTTSGEPYNTLLLTHYEQGPLVAA